MIIKELPEDFIVKEVLSRQPQQAGKYRLYLLTKKGWNTEDAASLLARVNNLRRKDVGFAGSKDKHAVTTQFLTVPAPAFLHGTSELVVEPAGYTNQRLVVGDLAGNRFLIVARDLHEETCIPTRLRLLNLFGPQRFGLGEKNVAVGRALVKGSFGDACSLLKLPVEGRDYVKALRLFGHRRLRFFVHAYQSFLWNLIAKCLHKSGPSSVPVVGFLSELSGDVGDAYAKVFEQEGITPKDFLVRSFPDIASEGWERNLFVDVELTSRWELDEKHENRKKCTLSFFLPVGSYATVVLAALFGCYEEPSRG